MFWSKKKNKEKITDPVMQYGQLLEKNKSDRKKQKKQGRLKQFFKPGYDSGFVYYDDE